jgi:flagellar hook-associated protein 3 FlgL
MRVTGSMLKDYIIDSLMAGQKRLMNIQQQISTSREVDKPSDDPVRFDRAARFKSLLSRNEQYLGNIEDGIEWVQYTMDALDVVYETAVLVRTETLRTRSDTFSAADKAQAAEAVEGFLQEMVLMGNTRFKGKYIFGGTITKDTEPFVFDGTTVAYQGNEDTILRKVGENAYLDINTVGSEFLDVFNTVIAIRDAMLANDGLAIDAALGQLETASESLLEITTSTGSRMHRLELTRSNLEMANVNLQAYISQAEDVDMSEAILRYNAQELSYRAALESSSRIMNISILNHLQ